MSPTRRDFLRTMAALPAAAALGSVSAQANEPPLTGTDPIFLSILTTSGAEQRGGNAYLRWDAGEGWIMNCVPIRLDTHCLRDADDTRWQVRARDHDDVDGFLRAALEQAMPPEPRILRAARADDYDDWDGDTLRDDPTISRWELDPDLSDEDLPGFLEANWFRVIDTRHVIRERMPWANAVVQVTRHHGWRDLRFYALVEGAGLG